MNRQPAFAPAAPLAAGRRVQSLRPGVCMVAEKSAEPIQHSPNAVRRTPTAAPRSSASWANIFLPEFGKKGPGSRPLWDLRPVSFREGVDVCTSCNGTGRMTCTYCQGLDHYGPEGKIPCPACGDEKEVTCSACFGTGKQIELVDNWWEEGIAALFKK